MDREISSTKRHFRQVASERARETPRFAGYIYAYRVTNMQAYLRGHSFKLPTQALLIALLDAMIVDGLFT